MILSDLFHVMDTGHRMFVASRRCGIKMLKDRLYTIGHSNLHCGTRALYKTQQEEISREEKELQEYAENR